MTPAQVAAVMGCPPVADPASLYPNDDNTGWELDAMDRNGTTLALILSSMFHHDTADAWSNGSVHIFVGYRDGKVNSKMRFIYLRWWKIKAREWLNVRW
jgi:hypothetical protein